MAPTPHANAGTAPTTSTGPPAPAQRQSCDRCHKQKLRCNRENNSNSGVCDRCFRKRVQCVYSFSLPKGRPSLYRVADESNAANTTASRSSGGAQEPAKSAAVGSDGDAEAEADAATKMNVDSINISNPSTTEASVMAGLMDTSLDMTTAAWPRVDTWNWDDPQLDLDWGNHDSTQVDAVLASLTAFGDEGHVREGAHPPSPSQPNAGVFETHDGGSRLNMEEHTTATGESTMEVPTDKYTNWPSLAIAQLSQLSTRLSSLRYSSDTLAKAAESNSCRLPNGRSIPLIDAAAFESVATWLAHGHGSANMNAHPSVPALSASQLPFPNIASEQKAQGGHGILHDVFSASHRLLEILRHLQVRNIVEPYPSPPHSASPPPTASSGQNTAYMGLTKGSWTCSLSSGNQQQCKHTMQIIRHLIMACEALLLEIYMAILVALQHDAYHGASVNTTALGDIRLVLVVQLCSHLIERQHQAVDLCLAPLSPLSPISVNGTFPQKFDMPGSQQSSPPSAVLHTADREALNELKSQVQQRLAHLRVTLRCT